MKNCKNCGAPNPDGATACVICHSSFETPAAAQAQAPAPKKGGVVKKILKFMFAIVLMAVIDALVTFFVSTVLYLDRAESVFLLACCAIVQLIVFLIFILYRQKAQHAAATAATDDDTDSTEHTDDEDSEADPTAEQSGFIRALSIGEPTVISASLDENATLVDATALLAEKSGGLTLHSARALLAAFAARRMVILSGKDVDDVSSAIAAITALFGAEIPTVALSGSCTEPKALYLDEAFPASAVPSRFLLHAYGAANTPRSLRTLLLQPEAPVALGGAFSALTAYLATSTAEAAISIHHTDHHPADHIVLPANLRMLMSYRPGRNEVLAAELVAVGALVDLKLSGQPAAKANCGAISYNRFLHLLEEAEQQYYLAEDIWKHIDELSLLLQEKSGFVIENKTSNAIERFVGVYMSAGGTQNEALDAALASLVLPAVLMSKQLDTEGKEAISTFMDARFGLQNMPLCTEALKKLGTV